MGPRLQAPDMESEGNATSSVPEPYFYFALPLQAVKSVMQCTALYPARRLSSLGGRLPDRVQSPLKGNRSPPCLLERGVTPSLLLSCYID